MCTAALCFRVVRQDVARLPDNIPAHQAMLRQVELSVGRPQTLHGNVNKVDHVPNGPTNSAAITTISPLRLCGGKPLVAVTRERRYGPSRLRVNDVVRASVRRMQSVLACVRRPGGRRRHSPTFSFSFSLFIWLGTGKWRKNYTSCHTVDSDMRWFCLSGMLHSYVDLIY